MAHTFQLHRESLKRKFAVYVVVAKAESRVDLYVGKVGDNRQGCNPLISRCGNHFSYNKIHSQVRNKLSDHEVRDYVYVFEHFDDYSEVLLERRAAIDRINEMERWLNQEIQVRTLGSSGVHILNPYKGRARVGEEERKRRLALRTKEAEAKIRSTVDAVLEACGLSPAP